MVLEESNAFLTTYEHLPEFQKKLKEALEGFEDRYELVTDYRILPKERNIDLLIIDGGAGGDMDGGVNRNVYALVHYLDNIKAIFVDGNRKMQNAFIRKALRDRFAVKITVLGGEKEYRDGVFYECTRTRSIFRRYLM